jgi:hypothetical protein
MVSLVGQVVRHRPGVSFAARSATRPSSISPSGSGISSRLDNDGDGAIDLADADCHATEGISESSCGFGPELAFVMPALWWLRRRRGLRAVTRRA